MKIKSALYAPLFIFASTALASAADAIVYQEPAPVYAAQAFNWSGAYLGGQIGYGWGKSKATDREDGLSSKFKPDGFLGGLYAGYNFDTGSNFILGVDGDFTFSAMKDSKTIIDTDDQSEANFKVKQRWSAALRARAGVAVDRFMPYVSGGVAFTDLKITSSDSDSTLSDKKTLTGWTLGAGVDYAATDNIILRLEYRYTDFGKKNFSGGDANDGFNIRNKFKTQDLRVGVAYKF